MNRARADEQLRYADIEQALIAVLRVPEKGLGAFRGRVRHLRDLGVPHFLPPVGRGTQNDYSSLDALEMLLAFRLGKLNVPPALAAPFAYKIMMEYWYGAAAEARGELGDLFAFIFPSDTPPEDLSKLGTPSSGMDPEKNPPVLFARGANALADAERFLPQEFTRINVSSWARAIFTTLERIVNR